MPRTRHPKKDVEEALQHAEAQGWRIEVGGSHAWGKMYCSYNDVGCRCGEFCIASMLEYAEESRQPCAPAQARRRQLPAPQAGR